MLIIDTENNTYNKGSVFDRRFKPVCIGYKSNEKTGVVFSESELKSFREDWGNSNLLVFFNGKYDLHVLRTWGLHVGRQRIWCCQVAEYLLDRQQNTLPSLDGTADKYGLGRKLDKIKELWEQGVQTDEIDRGLLTEYVLQDVNLTHQIYELQQKQIKPHQKVLFSLAMRDLLCLEEIEWNGILYDREGIELKSKQVEAEIDILQAKLNLHHSIPTFNWGSPDHLSALLFGGSIVEERRVPAGYYKTGKRAGEVKYKKELVEHHLPRRFTPPRKTEGGKFSTAEDALVDLGDNELVQGILKLRELQKLNSTYLKGFLDKMDEKMFKPGWIHANFNQCITRTGRLSSSGPNLQNFPEELDALLRSRFG